MVGILYFPFGMVYVQIRNISFSQCIFVAKPHVMSSSDARGDDYVSSFCNTSPTYSNLEKQISPQKCFQVPFFLVCKSHNQPTIHPVKARPAVVRKVLGELDAAEFAKVSEHTVVTRASHVKRLGLGGWSTHPLWEVKFLFGSWETQQHVIWGFWGKIRMSNTWFVRYSGCDPLFADDAFLDSLVCC